VKTVYRHDPNRPLALTQDARRDDGHPMRPRDVIPPRIHESLLRTLQIEHQLQPQSLEELEDRYAALMQQQRERLELVREAAGWRSWDWKPPSPDEPASPNLCFVANLERFILRDRNGRWDFENQLRKEGAASALQFSDSMSVKEANKVVRLKNCFVVARLGMAPTTEELVDVGGHLPILNVNPHGVPEPEEGEFPLVQAMLESICGGDSGLELWLLNWMAFCAQHPDQRPGTAVTIHGPPGSGKTTMGKLIGYARGCWAEINSSHLTGNFNAGWTDADFVVCNEVLVGDARPEVIQKLKSYITDQTFRVEEKFASARHMENRKAWWFTSNSAAPVHVERGDRRYTVIEAPAASAELTSRMQETFATWEAKGFHLWPELRAFRHFLLNDVVVDRSLVLRPHDSEARRALIEAGLSSAEAFTDELGRRGNDLAALWKEWMPTGATLRDLPFTQEEIGGQAGFYRSRAVTGVYAAMCKATNRQPLGENRLSADLRKAGWKPGRTSSGRFWKPPLVTGM
jgi:hypothetical protein